MSIDNAALVIVDLQHDFLPGGALEVAHSHEIIAPIARLMPEFETVICTQDWHPELHHSFAAAHRGQRVFDQMNLHGKPHTLWPIHCVQGTPGAAIHSVILNQHVTMVLRKGTNKLVDSYSAFRENYGPEGGRRFTGLGGFLLARGINEVFVCGLARDFCVKWTAHDAATMGFASRVLWDLTRSVVPSNDHETERELKDAGVKIIRSNA